MKLFELIHKLQQAGCDNVEIVVRHEGFIGTISDVYIDFDHTDDKPFLAIDLDNED